VTDRENQKGLRQHREPGGCSVCFYRKQFCFHGKAAEGHQELDAAAAFFCA